MVMLMGDKGEDAGQHGKGEGMKASMWRAEALFSLPLPQRDSKQTAQLQSITVLSFSFSTFHPNLLRQNHSSFWFLPNSLSNIPVMFMAWHIL